jgi:hypothetical protein
MPDKVRVVLANPSSSDSEDDAAAKAGGAEDLAWTTLLPTPQASTFYQSIHSEISTLRSRVDQKLKQMVQAGQNDFDFLNQQLMSLKTLSDSEEDDMCTSKNKEKRKEELVSAAAKAASAIQCAILTEEEEVKSFGFGELKISSSAMTEPATNRTQTVVQRRLQRINFPDVIVIDEDDDENEVEVDTDERIDLTEHLSPMSIEPIQEAYAVVATPPYDEHPHDEHPHDKGRFFAENQKSSKPAPAPVGNTLQQKKTPMHLQVTPVSSNAQSKGANPILSFWQTNSPVAAANAKHEGALVSVPSTGSSYAVAAEANQSMNNPPPTMVAGQKIHAGNVLVTVESTRSPYADQLRDQVKSSPYINAAAPGKGQAQHGTQQGSGASKESHWGDWIPSCTPTAHNPARDAPAHAPDPTPAYVLDAVPSQTMWESESTYVIDAVPSQTLWESESIYLPTSPNSQGSKDYAPTVTSRDYDPPKIKSQASRGSISPPPVSLQAGLPTSRRSNSSPSSHMTSPPLHDELTPQEAHTNRMAQQPRQSNASQQMATAGSASVASHSSNVSHHLLSSRRQQQPTQSSGALQPQQQTASKEVALEEMMSSLSYLDQKSNADAVSTAASNASSEHFLLKQYKKQQQQQQQLRENQETMMRQSDNTRTPREQQLKGSESYDFYRQEAQSKLDAVPTKNRPNKNLVKPTSSRSQVPPPNQQRRHPHEGRTDSEEKKDDGMRRVDSHSQTALVLPNHFDFEEMDNGDRSIVSTTSQSIAMKSANLQTMANFSVTQSMGLDSMAESNESFFADLEESGIVRVERVQSQIITDPYGDVGRFTGLLIKGKPFGLGTMHYNDGRSYTGEWRNGRWSGASSQL